jgi:protein-tyrosine phosphatase
MATPDSPAMFRRVLFLCSGNYYRSRFCEELFNHHAAAARFGWQAISRALRAEPATLNPGPMSPFAVEYLRQRGIRPLNHLRLPLEVSDFDWHTSDVVVAMNDPEHRPMIEQTWPSQAETVRYWTVADVEELAPTPALHRLQRLVTSLLDELAAAQRSPRAAEPERLAI